jgi:hypothetical protein
MVVVDAEVTHFEQFAQTVDKQVLWFDIPVNDSLLVEVSEFAEELPRVASYFGSADSLSDFIA